VDTHVSRRLAHRGLARGVSAAGNAILGLIARGRASRRRIEIASHRGRCGEEFSQLARDIWLSSGIERSAAYLNWRFLDNPFERFRIMVARSRGQLRGYLVLAGPDDSPVIADLFGGPDPAVVSDLLAGAVLQLRAAGASTVSMMLSAGHP